MIVFTKLQREHQPVDPALLAALAGQTDEERVTDPLNISMKAVKAANALVPSFAPWSMVRRYYDKFHYRGWLTPHEGDTHRDLAVLTLYGTALDAHGEPTVWSAEFGPVQGSTLQGRVSVFSGTAATMAGALGGLSMNRAKRVAAEAKMKEATLDPRTEFVKLVADVDARGLGPFLASPIDKPLYVHGSERLGGYFDTWAFAGSPHGAFRDSAWFTLTEAMEKLDPIRDLAAFKPGQAPAVREARRKLARALREVAKPVSEGRYDAVRALAAGTGADEKALSEFLIELFDHGGDGRLIGGDYVVWAEDTGLTSARLRAFVRKYPEILLAAANLGRKAANRSGAFTHIEHERSLYEPSGGSPPFTPALKGAASYHAAFYMSEARPIAEADDVVTVVPMGSSQYAISIRNQHGGNLWTGDSGSPGGKPRLFPSKAAAAAEIPAIIAHGQKFPREIRFHLSSKRHFIDLCREYPEHTCTLVRVGSGIYDMVISAAAAAESYESATAAFAPSTSLSAVQKLARAAGASALSGWRFLFSVAQQAHAEKFVVDVEEIGGVEVSIRVINRGTAILVSTHTR